MKKLMQAMILGIMAFCIACLTGCQTVENTISSFGLKSDIEAQCKKYEERNDVAGMKAYLDDLLKPTTPKPKGWNESIKEFVTSRRNRAEGMMAYASELKSDIEIRSKKYEERNDGAGMKAYLDGLLNAEPKPAGWDGSVEALVNSWLVKANSLVLKDRIQTSYDKYIANREIDKAKDYLSATYASKGKMPEWNDSVEKLVKDLLVRVGTEVLKLRCEAIWTDVKAALDKRDFAAARRLTATAAPCVDEEIRDAVLAYRIGVLNEVINPYQSDWVIHEMKVKVAELKQTGKEGEVPAYLDSVALIKDEIPSIEQKVLAIKPALENLYWLDDRIQSYLRQNAAEIRKLLDARAVAGEYREYTEVYDLVDAAVAEMKLYNPIWGSGESAWASSMRSVRRTMTTAEANAAILAAKEALRK